MSLLNIWNWLKVGISDIWSWLINADLMVGLKYFGIVFLILFLYPKITRFVFNYPRIIEKAYEIDPKFMNGMFIGVFVLLAVFILAFILGIVLGFSSNLNIILFCISFILFIILALIVRPKSVKDT